MTRATSIAACLLLALACGKSDRPTEAREPRERTTPADEAVAKIAAAARDHDRSAGGGARQPVLTEERMQRFLKSLEEDHNPFGVLGDLGQAKGIGGLVAQAEKYDAFARKYGFKDYGDYAEVWGTVFAAGLEEMAVGLAEGARGMVEASIKQAEEQLRNPKLPAELRAMYQEMIESGRESLKEMERESVEASSEIHPQDRALIQKHKARIDAAMKKLGDRSR